MNTNSKQVLFIDANVLDAKSIIDTIAKNIDVFQLDNQTSTLDQIATILDGYHNLDVVHIISHGAEGTLAFANGGISKSNVNDYSAQLKRIGSALSATGDMLLYGCDVANGYDGLTFINTLADLTGADVAASNDLTGSALLGGNKQLEINRGMIEAMPIDFSYAGLLTNKVTSSTLLYIRHTMGEFANMGAFAAIKSNGSVVTWGLSSAGGDSRAVDSKLNGTVDVVQIFSNNGAFAALRADGSVVTWGDSYSGGDSSAVASKLDGTVRVMQVFSNFSDYMDGVAYGAFAALRVDGSVVTWGFSDDGGDSSAVASKLDGTVDVVQIFSNRVAFAALRADGSVVTWGKSYGGGDSTTVASKIDGTNDVVQVFSTESSFAALRTDGTVVTWGGYSGGDSSAVASKLDGNVDVVQIFSNYSAFAALRADGSVVTWGISDWGDSSAVASKLDGTIDVEQIFSNNGAFAALRADGSVVTWGRGAYGGDSSAVASKLDGTIDVVQIFSTSAAFAALRADGSVVTLGKNTSGGDSTAVASKLDGTIDVVQIFSANNAFAALLADGSVVTWGNSYSGGDSSAVATELSSGVLTLANIQDNTNLVFKDTNSLSTKINHLPTGSLDITGAAFKGHVLTASNSFSDIDGVGRISYVWLENDEIIPDATQSTYKLTQENAGKNIKVKASYIDLQDTPESVVSNSVLISPNSAPTGTISISGTTIQNQVLTASNNLADADGLGTIGYLWLRDGYPISAFTQSTYTLTQADVGKKISIKVSYTDALGAVENLSSLETTAIIANDAPTGTVKITGTAIKGQVLTASNNLVDTDGLGAINYTWLNNGVVILNATQSTYKLTQADTGQNISVKASYTDALGAAESVVSSDLPINKNILPTGTVTIKGLSTWGTTLSIINTIKDADGLGTLSYTWQNDSGELSTSSKYILQKSDVGKQVWAMISYTDKKGNSETVKSNVIDVTVSTKPSAVNDILTGTDPADKLSGLAGNDTLIGGLGKDTLTGGAGADVFKFTSISDSSTLSKQADTITDFKHTQGDKIDLSAIDINPTLEGRQSFIPINAQTFSADATGQLRFDIKTSTLYGSTNSDSAPEFAIVLSGVKSLVAEDFIL
jgi:hypothetical protein